MRRGPARPATRRTARRTTRRTTRRVSHRRRRTRRRRRRRVIIGGMAVIGIGYGVYKLTQKDVDQIEQYTGEPVEDLSEEQMDAAMDQLGIQDQEVTDADVAQLDAGTQSAPAQAPAAQSAPQAAAPAQPAPPAEPDYLAELQRLADFKDQGIITEEEFETKKKQLLGL